MSRPRDINITEYIDGLDVVFEYLAISGDTFTELMLVLERKEPEKYKEIREEFEKAILRNYIKTRINK